MENFRIVGMGGRGRRTEWGKSTGRCKLEMFLILKFTGIHYIKNINKRVMQNPVMITCHESRL